MYQDTTPQPRTIEQALSVLLDAIAALPTARWPSVRAQLDQAAAHPDLRERVLDARGRLHAHLLVFRNDRELDRATALGEPVTAGDRIDLVAAAEGG